MDERRTGHQRRKPIRHLKLKKDIGRRLEDFEFSVLIKMGIITFMFLVACVIGAMYIK
jgi:hypothetical protein